MSTTDAALDVSVLGPIRVVDGRGDDVTPSGDLVKRLLALLVLHRGRRLTVDAAVDALWPVARPERPVPALQNLVFRLRQILPTDALVFVADGYRLETTAVHVDVDWLAHALEMGDAIDASTLVEIDTLLDRWRGPAYPELDDDEDGRIEATRLEETRVRARELIVASQIASGDTDEAIPQLMELVNAHPVRERPRALLMEALSQTGRQVEALRVFDDFRRLVGDELGIEPSPMLAAMHADLLAGTSPAPWTATSRVAARRTSLIGRDEFLSSVTSSVVAGRLNTLVGPGGVGKTRLLVELGHRLFEADPSIPVVQCELALADARTAVDLVATALGIDVRPGESQTERIVRVVGRSHLVLLLDNCEHVLEPIAELVEIVLDGCVAVSIIATSRERLRVRGEHVHVVPTLPAGTREDPAVRLFLERALAADPGLTPDDAALDTVVEIVGQLDGLPLAIELAAARLHTSDLAEIAAGLNDRVQLLSSGYRTSSRHGSLAAAVAWSFDLLGESLQRTFTDVSIFSRPFDVPDAAAVCGTSPGAVGPLLTQLAERSLVARRPDGRYAMLETLRAYAADRLVAAGRAEVVGGRHAARQVAWAAEVTRRTALDGGRPLAEIDDAMPELRAGFEWLVDHDDIESAGRLVASLWLYGFMRLRPDVLAWAEQLLDADAPDADRCTSEVWVVAAYAAWMAGDVAETGRRTEQAMRLARGAEDGIPPLVATISGSFELFEGRVREAAAWYHRAADLDGGNDPSFVLMARASEALALGYASDPFAARLSRTLLAEIGDLVSPHAAYTWYCAGEAALALGDVDDARVRLERSVELADMTNASFVFGIAGASKASIEARTGDPERAAAQYRDLIRHWRRSGMWSTQWTMLRAIAVLLSRLDRPDDAAVLEGAVRATAAGHQIFGADATALDELSTTLCATLGAADYHRARRRGATLDGDAAADAALRALAPSPSA